MTSCTTTTINNPDASTSSCPADPLSPDASVYDEEEHIMREALVRVERVKAQKAEEAAKRRAEESSRRRAEEKGGCCMGRSSEEASGTGGMRSARMGSTTGRRSCGAEEAVGRSSDHKKSAGNFSQKGICFPKEAPGGDQENGEGQGEGQGPGVKRSLASLHLAREVPSYANPAMMQKYDMAQLLANNQQLREGQVKANTYDRHFNWKLDWLMMDAARRRNLPLEMLEAGPLSLPKKRKRIVDSNQEEEDKRREEEKDGEGEEEEEGEGEELALKKARWEKGKEREE
ncbi:hypothetical protein EV359DRAFT_87760 [Lentinula novae-zelandiae]|nr:hypothetical protein EV359DRAFT_87760 [Lentinula novae-zelandiae]